MTGRLPAGWPTTLWVGLFLLASGHDLGAQQTPAPARDAAVDTLRVDPADTVPDPAAGDTLSLRERVLQRLRALPTTPFTATADTTGAQDTAQVVIAQDTAPRGVLPDLPPPAQEPARQPDPDAARDTLPRDTLAARDTTVTPDTVVARETPLSRDTPVVRDAAADTVPGLPGDTLGVERELAPSPAGDTLVDPGGPVRGDSVRALLEGLEGYARTEYEGEAAVFEAETNVLRMTGAGRVGRGGEALATDSLLVYSGETGVVCGYGNPVLTSQQGEPVESERVCYDIGRELGVAEGARTTFQQQGTWYVRGPRNRVYVLTGRPQSEVYGEHTDFTSCDLPDPHYTFNAGALKMVENDVMVARDVTLRFRDVPVFWLPWLVQSMKDGRRSGLLMPEFGVNDIVRTGSSERSIQNLGFYWAVNDYISARGTFGWLSNNWTSLEGALSYRWLRQFLNGSLNVRHYWQDTGSRDLTIGTNNSWQPDERTRLSVAGNYASSTAFVRDNSFDPNELNRRITMNGSVQRRFDWGNVTAGARRSQHLADEKVELMLPDVSLTLNPVTLFTSPSGMNSLTWNGSARANRRTTDVLDTLAVGRDRSALSASANHRLGFGRFSVTQDVDWSDEYQPFRSALNPEQCFLTRRDDQCFATGPDGEVVQGDTALVESLRQELRWSTSTSYQQDLWTGTTLTPSISVSGRRLKDPRTDDAFVDEPFRFSLNSSLNTTVYGFWPGVGPFSRIRHKINPRLSWSYSPTADDATALQDSIFGLENLRESNQLSLSFNQTFEAKYADSDTVSEERVQEEGGGLQTHDPIQDGEPRRLPQARKITLLAINTSTPFTYDFVARREQGRGFLTERVNNSIRSDLLTGLQLSTTHELFRTVTVEGEQEPIREFAPFLTRLTTSFSIDQDFWLFQVLGLSGGPSEDGTAGREVPAEGEGGAVDPDVGAESEPGSAGRSGSLVPGSSGGLRGQTGVTSGWRASLNYSLDRRRPESVQQGSQMLSGNVSFAPTEHWSLNWSTAYSFTDQEFTSHTLRLTRDLHRWQANFDFSKTQNGNFRFSFRVTLLDNQDLEFDYDQYTNAGRSGLGRNN